MRETWGSRRAFILAAIGSAIGLGNIWRFPYVAYANGGGAFLVAYFACLFIAGIPVMMLEFGLGHRYRQAAPGAFRSIRPSLEWFGWMAALLSFVIVVYYAIIMTWCVNYTYEAATQGWKQEPGLYADPSVAIAPTLLSDMEVLTPVPGELAGSPFVSPVSGTPGVVRSEPTTIVMHQGCAYGFPTRAQAEAFARQPCVDEHCVLTSGEGTGTSVLPRVPAALLGRPYVSPVDGSSGVVMNISTILVAYGGRLYGFDSVDEASTFMGSPGDFFFNRFLGITSSPWDMGSFRWPLLIGFIISWVWIIASIWKGTKTVGRVVYYTVIIPWVLLLVFIIRGVTLPGAGAGLAYYLTPEWGRLLSGDIWLAALTQVFFSLSVGFGVMIAYGSFLPKKANLAGSAFIIGIADALTAFCGGLAVFSALGFQASRLGVPVSEVVKSGPGLAFVAYPHIISSLPGAPVFGVLFFLMLLTLAVDSAFSLVEGVTASIKDKWGLSHRRVNLMVGGAAFLLGLPMLSGAGLHILDIVDHFMNNISLALVVLGQILIVGWFLPAEKMRTYINANSGIRTGLWWNTSVRWIIPMGMLWMLASEIRARTAGAYGSFELRSQEFLLGWLVVMLLPVVGDLLASGKGSWKD